MNKIAAIARGYCAISTLRINLGGAEFIAHLDGAQPGRLHGLHEFFLDAALLHRAERRVGRAAF